MSRPISFADLWEGAGRLCLRLGLAKIHILSDEGRPIATYEKKPGFFGRIDESRYVVGEPAVNVSLVLASRRGRSR